MSLPYWHLARLIGNTPCIELAAASVYIGCRVYGKIETVNPTGSHKDRENLEVVRYAINNGFKDVGCASTGNAAISLAALSRMLGLTCHIYISSGIWPEKLSLIRAFRPVIHVIRGSYEEAIERSKKEMDKAGVYAANPGQCIAKIEGNRNIGREICREIAPDVIVCPTNNGTHFIGVWEGIRESHLNPMVIAATARSTKIADSIAGFHRYEGRRWNEAAKESKVQIVNVSDREIREGLAVLLRDGIIAEPAAATGIAALTHIKTLNRQSVACCTITGNGLKFPRLMQQLLV
jgi:threonine synthase